ncbi:MAG: hypothetical protein AAF756_08365 [Pseudomonadota bacterium]
MKSGSDNDSRGSFRDNSRDDHRDSHHEKVGDDVHIDRFDVSAEMLDIDGQRELSDTDAELLSQYLDGELPPQESRNLERRLRTEALLQESLVKMQECNNLLRDALGESDRVPPAVQALLESESSAHLHVSADVLPFPAADKADKKVLPKPLRWNFAAAAAVVVAAGALTIGGLFDSERSGLPGNDSIVSNALDNLPSGSEWHLLVDGRELRGVLTFPHENGNWCREYLLRNQDADWRAVACREGSTWVTQAAGLESYLETSNAYRPAGVEESAPVAVFISQHAADIALDGRSETALIDNGWR